MVSFFRIADNVVSVSVLEGLRAWEDLQGRYSPFAVQEGGVPALEVEVKTESLLPCDGEVIYEPKHQGLGLESSCTYRLSDGTYVLEFRHIESGKLRLRLNMPDDMRRAEIVLAPGGDSDDAYFLTHALMLAFLLATIGNGTLLVHASTVVRGGRAYLFQGKSGTGKSTHAALWVKHIAGTELLNDDHPAVRFSADGAAMAYGTPWSGKTDCYRNESARVGAFVRIVRDQDNELRRLAPFKAFASLGTSTFYLPFFNEDQKEARIRTIERLAMEVPCCEMHCRPDADAAFACLRGLSINIK